jgi:hypothetical protein
MRLRGCAAPNKAIRAGPKLLGAEIPNPPFLSMIARPIRATLLQHRALLETAAD